MTKSIQEQKKELQTSWIVFGILAAFGLGVLVAADNKTEFIVATTVLAWAGAGVLFLANIIVFANYLGKLHR